MKLFVSDYRALIARNATELTRRMEEVAKARDPASMQTALEAAQWTFARIQEIAADFTANYVARAGEQDS